MAPHCKIAAKNTKGRYSSILIAFILNSKSKAFGKVKAFITKSIISNSKEKILYLKLTSFGDLICKGDSKYKDWKDAETDYKFAKKWSVIIFLKFIVMRQN